MVSGPITSWQIEGEKVKAWQLFSSSTLKPLQSPCAMILEPPKIKMFLVKTFLFWGAPKSLHMVTAAMKLKDAFSLEEML